MLIMEPRPPQASSRAELDAYLDLVQSREPRETISQAKSFVERFPGSEFLGHVWRFQMKSYQAINDAQNAIAAGTKALELNSHDVEALLTLAHLLPVRVTASEQPSQVLITAQEYARRALGEVQRLKAPRPLALETWRETRGRMKASAHEALGVIAFKQGHYSRSVAELEMSTRANVSPQGSQFYRLGMAYLFDKKPQEAMTALRRASELGPEAIRLKAESELSRLSKGRIEQCK